MTDTIDNIGADAARNGIRRMVPAVRAQERKKEIMRECIKRGMKVKP